MYEAERPPDEEVNRLILKYGSVKRVIVHWDQRHVDYRRQAGDPRRFGEVVLLIQDGEGRLALVRERESPPHAFDLPTGLIEEGEDVERAAMREAKEETGRAVQLEELSAIYQVRVRWWDWNLERWFFVFRCTVLPGGRALPDATEIEEVVFARLPEEMPEWWRDSEWWGGEWRRRILETGGVL